MATLDDEDRRDIADIVRAEVIKALGIAPNPDPQSSGEVYKRNIGDIVKLQGELLRIDMEKTGQIPPRHG